MTIFVSIIAFLALPALGRLPEDHPVELAELKNINIKNYNGDLNASSQLALHWNLEKLEIVSSVLSALDLCSLRNLKSLTMKKNDLTKINIDKVCFGQPEKIEFWNNDYSDHEAWMLRFGEYESLKILGLSHQNFRILENDWLYNNQKLERLSIELSSLVNIEHRAFIMLHQLKYLSLRDNRISWIRKEVYAPLKNLREINLRGNQFTRLAADMFYSLPNLVEMNFDYNNLTVIDLDGIEKVAPKLRYVHIDGFSNDSFQCSKSMECVFSEKIVPYKISLENKMTEPTI